MNIRPPADPRRAQLRRMRLIAVAMLTTVVIAFLGVSDAPIVAAPSKTLLPGSSP